MLATANSSVAAVTKLKERGARDIRFVCLLAAPEGIANFTGAHPDVPVFTAAIDSHLNEKGYIVPGLGDAGDRMYGTKVAERRRRIQTMRGRRGAAGQEETVL